MGNLDGVLNRRLGRELDMLGVDLGKTGHLSASVIQDWSVQQQISTSGKLPVIFMEQAE